MFRTSALALVSAFTLLACAATPTARPSHLDPSDPSAAEAPHHSAAHALSDAPAAGPERVVSHYACPHHPEVTSKEPGTCPKCHMALEPVEAPAAAYACPHHPEVTSKEPGTCPKCHMALEPVEPGTGGSGEAAPYACPHHPEVTSQGPGTCQKCGGMALVPVAGAKQGESAKATSKRCCAACGDHKGAKDGKGCCAACGDHKGAKDGKGCCAACGDHKGAKDGKGCCAACGDHKGAKDGKGCCASCGDHKGAKDGKGCCASCGDHKGAKDGKSDHDCSSGHCQVKAPETKGSK